jgi:iron complex outermembrane receptor protein
MMMSSGRVALFSSVALVSCAQAAAGQAQVPASAAQDQATEPQDIIVTATKRSERLLEVPLSISVVESSTMASQNLVKLQDVVARVPGLAIDTGDNGRVQLAIRGVTTGGLNNSTVGVTIDDVPVGGSTGVSYGSLLVPELDPGVIQQVEVLRGPQGTLYGASSLGGLLRYVTADPRLDRFSGSVAVSASSVAHGEGGFGTRARLNLPLAPNVALLVNGFFRRDPGYVDDAGRGLKNVNRVDNYGGRAALLWRPDDALSVKLAALFQKSDGDGSSLIDATPNLRPLSNYNQNRLVGSGPYSRKMQLYTATVALDLGFATATSVTGYGISDATSRDDVDAALGFYAFFATGRTDVGATSYFSTRTKKFTQELRLASPTNEKFEWLIGGFYTDEKNNPFYHLVATTRTTGAIVGEVLPDRYPSSYKEYSGFATFTYHFTDRLDLQAGGRYGHNEQVYDETIDGPLYNPPYAVHATSSENVFTYSVTPRFRISPNQTLYARVAAGYRPGGPNAGAGFGFPATYHSDSTVNYEIGYKASLLDRKLSFEASVYRIDWKNIQLQQVDPVSQFVFYANASRARSQGFEVMASLRPVRALTIAATLGYTDAVLRQGIPSLTGSPTKGTRLPFAAPWSASLGADYDVAISAATKASFGANLNYLDKRSGAFASYGQARYPAYTTADLHASLTNGDWRLSVFASNILDKRVAVSGDQKSTGNAVFAIIINRPRTIGMELSRAF